jgi:Peptidase family M23
MFKMSTPSKITRYSIWVLSLCLSITIGLSCARLQATETALPTHSSIVFHPGKTVVQGSGLWLEVKTTSPLPKGTKARFLGKLMPLYWASSTPEGAVTYVTVFGVNVDQAPKAYPLDVVLPDGQTWGPAESVVVKAKAYGKQNIAVSKSTGGLQPIKGEMEAIQKLKDVLTPVKYWEAGGFVSPTVDCQNSGFGVRRYHNGKYSGNYHKGVDLRSPQSRPVRATAAGVVQIGTTAYRLHGGTVGLDHGQGVSSIYIHLSKVLVKPGQSVKAGQVIGEVGSTGFATGPHLHWGLYVAGQPVDPNPWVPFKHCQ